MIFRKSCHLQGALTLRCPTQRLTATRLLSSAVVINVGDAALRRSYQYVPSSSERMLQKSMRTSSDVIIYDLEDSIAPLKKADARQRLSQFLTGPGELLGAPLTAVRVNAVDTPEFSEDIRMTNSLLSSIGTLVLPKIHSPEDLDVVAAHIEPTTDGAPVRIVASIESARALWNVGGIASWRDQVGSKPRAVLAALLFAAEDYCADTGIIRTPTRTELLYTRSRIVATAKAFKLDAIDMVCVNYKDAEYLRDECEDGRRLGYTGKQAIHPAQVETINKTFLPTALEILRAARIVHQMEHSHRENRGAFGLDAGDGSGGKEMIDAPMLKQAQNILRAAKAADLHIPKVE